MRTMFQGRVVDADRSVWFSSHNFISSSLSTLCKCRTQSMSNRLKNIILARAKITLGERGNIVGAVVDKFVFCQV